MLKTAQEMSARIETKKHSKAIENEMQTIDKQIQMSQKLLAYFLYIVLIHHFFHLYYFRHRLFIN